MISSVVFMAARELYVHELTTGTWYKYFYPLGGVTMNEGRIFFGQLVIQNGFGRCESSPVLVKLVAD